MGRGGLGQVARLRGKLVFASWGGTREVVLRNSEEARVTGGDN